MHSIKINTPSTQESIPSNAGMFHKITSYKQSELYKKHEEYTTEASTDEEAVLAIHQLRQSGHTISGWTQNARKGK